MNYTKTAIFGLLLALSIACETDIDLKLPEQERLLTVQSIFRPDMPWKFHVSKSELPGRSTDFKVVNNATIEIYGGNTLLIKAIGDPLGTPGEYFSEHHQPTAGQSYTLKVSAPGFPDVEAQGMVPLEHVQNVDLRFPKSATSQYSRGGILEFDDVSSARNYYHVVLETRTVEWLLEGSDTIYNRSDYQEIGFSISDQGDGLVDVTTNIKLYRSAFGIPGVLFSDETFNNSRFRLDFEIFNINSSGADEVDDQIFQEYRVQLRHVSSDYYKYYRSLFIQEETADDPFAEPIFIHNNIENGLGNFSGYNRVNSNVVSIL